MADSPDELRDRFLGWQCRLRQLAVRQDGGRPNEGMRPRIGPEATAGGERSSARPLIGQQWVDHLVVLIVERDPANTTAHLRHLCRRSADPRDRYTQALSLLRAGYYQYPNRFSDAMTALFAARSERAAALRAMERCVLHFEQYSQAYCVPCCVRSLDPEDPAYQATFYHNAVFNPGVPPDAEILAFAPDWERASGWQTGEP